MRNNLLQVTGLRLALTERKVRSMPSVTGRAGILCSAVAALVLLLALSPAAAFSLFDRHQVTVQFATQDGKPLANAEVKVFAPDAPKAPVVTGRADGEGKFVFEADRDGFWSAEAHEADQVARVMIRVGDDSQPQSRFSPLLIIGALAILTAVAIWYRVLRARGRPPRS